MYGVKRKFLFVSITGLRSDIAWQVGEGGPRSALWAQSHALIREICMRLLVKYVIPSTKAAPSHAMQ
jgi:hypothetical protein